MPPILTISIVHHDGREMLRNCLHSLFRHPPEMPFEVIVVDNASTDGAREMLAAEFPQVRTLCRTRRHGFGDNHNRAMEIMRGKFLLLLNDDTLTQPHALDALLGCAARHPSAGVIGAKLLNEDGSLQPSCYKFPSPMRAIWENLLLSAAFPNNKRFGDYRNWVHDEEKTIDFVTGAAMLVRREAINDVGGFDKSFFMYAEETDWQKRLNNAGWLTVFCPDAPIVHLGGKSSEMMPSRQFVEFHRSGLRYMTKWHGRAGAFVYRMAIVTGAILRLTVWSIIGAISPTKRQTARAQRQTWARLLRWWLGLDRSAGLREAAEQGSNPS